jgi:hypothetical protein
VPWDADISEPLVLFHPSERAKEVAPVVAGTRFASAARC